MDYVAVKRKWTLESNTTESTYSSKRTTDTKCNYRQEVVNIYSIMSCKVKAISAWQKIPHCCD